MRSNSMTVTRLSTVAALLFAAALTTGCANTIRGMGSDTANAVNATQQAGSSVAAAAE
jgi:entericidin B